MTKRYLSYVLSGCLLALPASAETVRGQVRVIDGDTFRFDSGLKVRIFGIDTLEKNQKCELADACIPCGKQTMAGAMKLIGTSG
jgi:endonuclease YncB( thermonuclease family)